MGGGGEVRRGGREALRQRWRLGEAGGRWRRHGYMIQTLSSISDYLKRFLGRQGVDGWLAAREGGQGDLNPCDKRSSWHDPLIKENMT
jgi:hypothetical protein